MFGLRSDPLGEELAALARSQLLGKRPDFKEDGAKKRG